MRRNRASAGFTLVELLTVILIIGILAAILAPRFWRGYYSSQYTACLHNLHNVNTAVQSYAQDNDRRLPTTLSLLSPDYLEVIPTCPSASQDTYSETYVRDDASWMYTVYCKGTWHVNAGRNPDEPWLHGDQGVGP